MESLPFHRRVLARFSRVPVALFAAALSYYALLGLFPLLLLLVGLAGLVLAKNPELYASFEGELRVLVTRLFPAAEGAAREILEALTQGATGFTLGSAVLLFWTASHFFTALSSVLSEVFGTRPRPWQTRFLGLLGPVLLGLALMLASALSLVLGLVVGLLPQGPWRSLASPAATYAASVLVLFFIYRFLPSPPPPSGPALFFAILAALGWSAVVFAVGHFLPLKRYALVYGPLAGPALLLLGFYLLMWVLIVGAVALAAYANPEPSRKTDEPPSG